jgi:tetrapyrrole methylase family protein/MazG family protein
LGDSVNSTQTTPIGRIEALIQTLRGEHGCPWDKKQTPATLTRYLVEEAYELVDAIIAGDAEAVCEEAGDVLFQLLFVIHLFTESGQFGLDDVVEKNIEKMVRRHPHVFGDATAQTPEKVSRNWERIKRKEKAESGPQPLLSAVPKHLSALARAAMVSERAAKTGFDWEDISGVMDKTMEEWEEFSRELKSSGAAAGSDEAATEFGDVLFSMVNVARFANIHPETALIRSIQKFEQRFTHMEQNARKAGQDLHSLTVREMHNLWEAAKDSIG